MPRKGSIVAHFDCFIFLHPRNIATCIYLLSNNDICMSIMCVVWDENFAYLLASNPAVWL